MDNPARRDILRKAHSFWGQWRDDTVKVRLLTCSLAPAIIEVFLPLADGVEVGSTELGVEPTGTCRGRLGKPAHQPLFEKKPFFI